MKLRRLRRQPAILHVTHWKAGSQWIHAILKACVPARIVEPREDMSQFLAEPVREGGVYPTLYVTREQFEQAALPKRWRRFVVIRDLRDTVVSAYFSVKTSHSSFGEGQGAQRVQTMRDELQELDLEQGMIAIAERWLPWSVRIQRSWLEAGEEVIRYEDLLERDLELLEEVLIHRCELPISPAELEVALEDARFERLSGGRRRGEEDPAAHFRKGIAGDWRNYFTEPVKESFKAKWGQDLIRAGYETSLDW